MASSFTWMDYSEQERRKALEVIDLFQERDVRDELGIGTVRDTLADLLFPGTSTIQTRARYFLFIPWLYLAQERARTPSTQMSERIRAQEIVLIGALARSSDREGVIGIDRRERLKRTASSIYWQGLAHWGIRLAPGSQEQYHRSLDRFYRSDPRVHRHLLNDDREPVEDSSPANWHGGLPAPPDGFPRTAELALRREEAEYLRERITVSCRGTLLAYLVNQEGSFSTVDFPWLHPAAGRVPGAAQEQLEHARCFSEALHGAALLYNLLLAEARADDGRSARYRDGLRSWAQLLDARSDALRRWDRRRFWEIVTRQNGRIPTPTRRFIDSWLDLLAGFPPGAELAVALVESPRARLLIRERERALKRGLARLENRRALELWTGAAGVGQLNYRWHRVQAILLDILRAAEGDGPDA